MKPDFETAAIRAYETMVRNSVSYAPISPLPILKRMKGVLVVSFAEMADRIGIGRHCVLDNLNVETHDAFTAVDVHNGTLHYIVAYNQRLPTYVTDRALARELGHIVLHHDGTRPEETRNEEALVFARHLLCPRPLIRSIQDAGITVTTELLGNVTGCYERCQACIRQTPGAHVPPELNRLVRQQFADYVNELRDFQSYLSKDDKTGPVDFGTYMENYEE